MNVIMECRLLLLLILIIRLLSGYLQKVRITEISFVAMVTAEEKNLFVLTN